MGPDTLIRFGMDSGHFNRPGLGQTQAHLTSLFSLFPYMPRASMDHYIKYCHIDYNINSIHSHINVHYKTVPFTIQPIREKLEYGVPVCVLRKSAREREL